MNHVRSASELAATNGLHFSESLEENVQVLIELERQFRNAIHHNSCANSVLSAELETKLETMKNKKDALLKKMTQYVDVVETCAKQTGVQVKLPAVDQLRHKVEVADKTCNADLIRQKKFDHERAVVARCKEDFCQRMDYQTNNLENNVKRHQDHAALIRALTDVHDTTPCNDKYHVIVALTPRGLTDNEEAKTTVDAADFVRVPSASTSQRRPEVTLKFRPNSLGTELAAVDVNVESFDISDLVSSAVATNDVLGLMQSITQRWTKHYRLVKEIDSLRHRFALDWIHGEGLIRVIYGPNASIVCTLRLDPRYPDCSTGGVTLQSACGLPSGVTKDTLQIPATSTLKEALEFLANQFSNVLT